MEIRQTEEFSRWLADLRDLRARAKVQARIERLKCGNPGDIKAIREGIRVYLLQRDKALIILLAGGDKSSQSNDIKKSIALAKNLDQTVH